MSDLTRRTLIRALAASPLLAALPHRAIGKTSNPKGTREFDISAYDTALLPREHGQLYRQRRPLHRRYPSREQCMQMAAFFNEDEGMLVIGNDPSGGIADWEIKPGATLKIHFYGDVPDVQVHKIEPSVEAAAAKYAQWAAAQFWVRERIRNTRRLNFFSVASSPSIIEERSHIDNVTHTTPGPLGVWFTQWRRHPFDRMYPDYTPKEPLAFAHLLAALKKNGVVALPYINGLLWDRNLTKFRDTGNAVAVRTEDFETLPYNRKLDFLRYACPSSKTWRDCIVTARNNLNDADGQQSGGVYLDLVAAAAPLLCWASDHGHIPGDPYAWQRGLRELLKQTTGAVMVEGCAEVYLDLIDYALMHLYTAQTDTVPLWSLVYGGWVQPAGWQLPSGIDSAQFQGILKRAAACGVGAFATPWMTSEPERALFARNVVNRPDPSRAQTHPYAPR